MKKRLFKRGEKVERCFTVMIRDRAKKKLYVTSETFKETLDPLSDTSAFLRFYLSEHPGFEVEANDEMFIEAMFREFVISTI